MKRNSGYIIIESIIAITLAVVGLLGVVTLLRKALVLNRDISDKLVATYLAAEGIEIVRHLTDVNAVVCPAREWNNQIGDESYELDYETSFTGSGNINSRRINTADGMSDTPLRFDEVSGTYSYSSGDASHFTRTVFVYSTDEVSSVPHHLIIRSIVTWPPSDEMHTIRLEDHFYNWRSLPGIIPNSYRNPPCR